MADQATSIFTKSDQTNPKAVNTTVIPETKGDNPLAILVGEGRKYKSEAELAKAYIELDGFAEKLKGENAEMRDKLAGAKTVEDVLQRLKQPEASTTDRGEERRASALSADDVAKIVRDTVTGLETEKSRNENLLKADAAMKKLFGAKAGEVFATMADTPDKQVVFTHLASVDPDKFVKLFVPAAPASGIQTDSGTSVNTAALADTNQSARTMDPGCKEFYDAMRTKDRAKFYSTANQLAMHKAAQANPEKYFGRKLGA